ncbi:DUF6194 family protein [bacterium RCC_150]
MTIDEIIALVQSFEGTLAFTAGPEDGSPEIAWGDTFFYYAPDGKMPKATQPFATIVTKNYPDDEQSHLDRAGAFRVNIGAGKASFVERIGREAGELPVAEAPAEDDTVIAHPVYGSQGWLAVVNPGPSTETTVRQLLREAYEHARSRYERRAALGQHDG